MYASDLCPDGRFGAPPRAGFFLPWMLTMTDHDVTTDNKLSRLALIAYLCMAFLCGLFAVQALPAGGLVFGVALLALGLVPIALAVFDRE
jgi:hypothetical protein